MDKKELLRMKAEAYDKAMAIKAAAEGEKRAMTDEEMTEFEALVKKCEKADKDIAALDKANALSLQLSGFAPLETPANGGRKAEGSDPADLHIHVGQPEWEKDPKKGFKSPRDFMMQVMVAGKYPTHMSDNLKFMKTPAQSDPAFMAAVGSDEQGTHSDPFGGFLIPVGFSPEMLKIDPEPDFISGRTTMIPMATPQLKIPARTDKNHTKSVTGGLTVSRRAETTAAVASRMEMENVLLSTHSLFGLAFATEELLTDSPISFAAILAAGFSDEFTSHMTDERLTGTGVGEHLGINNSGVIVTIAKEDGQVKETITFSNIIKMRAQVWGYGKAIWMANQDTIPQLAVLSQVVGTGGIPIFMPSAREDIPDILLGRPIFYSEAMEKVGTKGDILIANWSEYLEGLLQPMQSAESIHVRFVNHERAFKFWLRNSGSPWWLTAITPKKSGKQLSPFVNLAARA